MALANPDSGPPRAVIPKLFAAPCPKKIAEERRLIRETVADLWAEDMSIPSIARHTDLTQHQVRRIAFEMQLPARGQGFRSKERRAAAAERNRRILGKFSDGVPADEIAEDLGCRPATVYNVIKRSGMRISKAPPPPSVPQATP
jgi:DNA-binding CsgD family transcriptional regulator